MVQVKAKIIHNKKLKGNYWHSVFDAPLIAKEAKPGQFLNIKLSDSLKPFLRRPFSIHNICGGKLEILYEVLGEGTKILSERKKGEYLDIIGPLGNGFDYSRTHALPAGRQELMNSRTILVAGGMGVAPLLFLSEEIKTKDKIALIGARAKAQVLCEKEFKNSGCDVKIATDDGSSGFKGRVTQLLEQVLLKDLRACALPAPPLAGPAGRQKLTSRIYACGPKPMLKAVSNMARKYKIPAQVSMEEHMSCGIGACLGCVVKTKKGLERVCKEGPVFEAQDIIWG